MTELELEDLQRTIADVFEQAEAGAAGPASEDIASAKARLVSNLAADRAARAWDHLLDHRGCVGSA